MKAVCFYSYPVSTSIFLKSKGQLLKVYNFYTMELKDPVNGVAFPVTFFQ